MMLPLELAPRQAGEVGSPTGLSAHSPTSLTPAHKTPMDNNALDGKARSRR